METEQMELTPEELERKSEEDFESGRMAARGEIEEPKEPKAEEATTTEGEPPPAQKAEDDTPVFIAGLTELELKQALAKAHQYDALAAKVAQETGKIYGKFGEIQSKLNELASKKVGKLTRLSESYPDIAEDLAADLEALTVGGEAPSNDAVLEVVNRNIEEKLRAVNVKMLTMAKPKWKEIIATPEWDLFLGTLPNENRELIQSSPDPEVAVQALNAFEEWAGRGKKEVQKKEEKSKRLQRAITPTGTAPEPPEKQMNDDAAFEAGRAEARKRLGLVR